MTRKDLQEKYDIIDENKEIMLFRKSGERVHLAGWCGNIALKNGKAVFQNKAYSTVADLENALVGWEKSLPYPVNTYCPMYREGYKIEARITYYLTEKLGFKVKHREWETYYAKEIGDNCELTFDVRRNITDKDDSVSITSRFGAYHFTQKVTDADTGVAVISSIVNGECLSMAKDMIDLMSVCDTKVVADIEAYTRTNENIFGIKPVSFKDMMIKRLEKALAQLKTE